MLKSLICGLVSFMNLKSQQVIARDPQGEILSPFDAKLIFPKYGLLAETSSS